MLPPSTRQVNPETKEEVYITDEMVDKLLDPNITDNVKRAADAKRKTLSKEEFHQLRALCKRDLFFLCYSILGSKRLSKNLHGNLCTHVKDHEQDRFKEYLLPRGHFKSTILTIGHSIQVVLPYTEEDRKWDIDQSPLPWPNILGTDCRLLIAHETHESAARFLYAITQHFTNNALLNTLFPDAIPSERKHRINKWELELPRSDIARAFPEPTIDTLGVGGKSQGRHYNYIKLDDIYGDKARESAAESETTKDWFDNIQSFFSTFKQDHLDLIGTRYSMDDVYEHAHERYKRTDGTSKLVSYCRRVEETETFIDNKGVSRIRKVPIFPEEFDTETLDTLRKNRKVFSAQYENDPDDGVSGFSADWKRYFYWTSHNVFAIFQGEKQYSTRINVRDLDTCILIDPGLGRSGGFAVTGMDHLGRVFVLQALRININLPELTDFVFKQVSRWQPRVVAVESDFFAAALQPWWTTEMSVRGTHFQVISVHTKKVSKDDRIMGLSQYMTAEKFYINETQDDLLREWKKVGKSRDVHIFDALAYGPEVWRPGYAPGQREIIETPIGGDPDGRDPTTGYSTINYG